MCLVWLRSSYPDGFHEQDLTPDLHSAGTLLHPLHPRSSSYHSYTQHLIVPHGEILQSPNNLCHNSYFVPLQTQRKVSCTVCFHTVGFENVRCNAEHPLPKYFKHNLVDSPGFSVFSVDKNRCSLQKGFKSKTPIKPVLTSFITLVWHYEQNLHRRMLNLRVRHMFC